MGDVPVVNGFSEPWRSAYLQQDGLRRKAVNNFSVDRKDIC